MEPSGITACQLAGFGGFSRRKSRPLIGGSVPAALVQSEQLRLPPASALPRLALMELAAPTASSEHPRKRRGLPLCFFHCAQADVELDPPPNEASSIICDRPRS